MLSTIKNESDGVILLEWENKRYKAHLLRIYANKNSKAGKSRAREDKKNNARLQTQIRKKARNEAHSN